MLNTLDDLLRTIDALSLTVERAGVALDERGFPTLERQCFVDQLPDDMVTFYQRNSSLVHDPSRTAICFYEPDRLVFRRVEGMQRDLREYQRFMAVVEPDVTVTADMDLEWQHATMLLNALAMALLASGGIKVIPNTRVGLPETQENLRMVPSGVVWASGMLGCEKLCSPADTSYLGKIVSLLPSRLALYGKRDAMLEEQLSKMGIEHRWYRDTHARKNERDGTRRYVMA